MSIFDPFSLYVKRNKQSHAGAVLQKKPYPYPNQAVSPEQIQQSIKYLTSAGYFISPNPPPIQTKFIAPVNGVLKTTTFTSGHNAVSLQQLFNFHRSLIQDLISIPNDRIQSVILKCNFKSLTLEVSTIPSQVTFTSYNFNFNMTSENTTSTFLSINYFDNLNNWFTRAIAGGQGTYNIADKANPTTTEGNIFETFSNSKADWISLKNGTLSTICCDFNASESETVNCQISYVFYYEINTI